MAALAHIQKNSEQCDLVITDYRMPKMNGYEFSLKIKELNNNIKIILISAYDNIEGYKGEFELLKKPIPVQTLIDKVKEM